MTSNEKFQEKLEMGTKAENLVKAWVEKKYEHIVDLRYQKHAKGGPRITGTTGSFVLPDFAVYDQTGNFLIDVKAKSRVNLIDGIHYFTVDPKLNDYLECTRIMNMDSCKIMFVYDNRKFMYDSAEWSAKHDFNNEFGSWAYIYRYDKNKEV